MNIKTLSLYVALIIALFVGAIFYIPYLYPTPKVEESQITPTVSEAGTDYNSGKVDGAISKAEALVSKESNNVSALLLLATSYAEKGSVSFQESTYGQKAIDVANRVLAIDPKNSEAYDIIGYANEIMNKFDDARKNYDKAIELDSQNAQAYSNEGHTYDLQGDLKTAATLYKKALTINPHNDHALLNSARISMLNNDFPTAQQLLNSLVAISVNARLKAAAYQLLAFMESKSATPDIEKAIGMLNISIKLDPTIPQSYVSLADLYIKNIPNTNDDNEYASDISKAKTALNTALSINSNQASAYYELSQIAFIEGDGAAEAKYKQKALDAIPNDITLGAIQKKSLKETLDVKISNVKVTPLQ